MAATGTGVERLAPFFDWPRRVATGLSVACLAAMMLIYLGSLALRLTTHTDLSWASTIATWLFMWVVFVGSSVVIRTAGLFAVDFLVTKLPGRSFTLYVRLLGAVFVATGVSFIVFGLEFMRLTTGLAPSVGVSPNWANAAIPVSGVFFILEGLYLVIRPKIYPRQSAEERGIEAA